MNTIIERIQKGEWSAILAVAAPIVAPVVDKVLAEQLLRLKAFVEKE
jgi:hypothetical protein